MTPDSPASDLPETAAKTTGKLGLVLGSGAARGWAHFGVLQALEELKIKPDVIAGCSVGGLVGGAHLLGVLPDFAKWARELGPLGALKDFAFTFSRGGLLDPASAFEAFRDADRQIEDLPVPFAVNATDLATGKEVIFASGSTIDAVRASSAIPMIFSAAKVMQENGVNRWLVDGALCNPVPVNLARSLGADKVIAVDLNSISRTLERFSPPESRDLIVRELPAPPDSSVLPERFAALIASTQKYVADQVALARSRMKSRPHLIETAIASADIVQANLGDVRALIDKPDLRLTPDLRAYSHISFDQPDAMIEIGYETTMAAKTALKELAGTDEGAVR